MIFSANASADCTQSVDDCWYTGVAFGKATKSPVVDGTSWQTTGKTDNSFKFAFGKNFSTNWFAEVNYVKLGTARLSSYNASNQYGYINYNAINSSIGYRLLPNSNNYSIWFKAGMARIESNSNFIDDSNDTVESFGVGFEWYKWQDRSLGMSLESLGEDVYTISLEFKAFY